MKGDVRHRVERHLKTISILAVKSIEDSVSFIRTQ
jgi:hypothetical protein